MSTTARKIVIQGRRRVRDNGNAEYMARRRAEKAERQLMFQLLLRWERGFGLEDAPPESNEWTRRSSPCSNSPR